MAAGAREPEAERHRGGGDERERVPVADRVAQAGDAGAVGEERRHDLPESAQASTSPTRTARPRGHRPCRPRQPCGEQPEPGEGAVDEDPVERVPGAVGRDRPPHRQPDPGGEARPSRTSAARAAPRGAGTPRAESPTASAITAERADPEETAVRGRVAEEQGDEQQRAGGGEGRRPGELGGLHRRPTLAQRLSGPGFTDPLRRLIRPAHGRP